MKANTRTIFISAITIMGLMLNSCSNNNNDQAAIEKRRADSIEAANKVLQDINDQNNQNAQNDQDVKSDQGKSQLAASLKVINDDISVCDANITSGTVAITVNTNKKFDKSLTQAERDAASEKLAAAVILVKVNSDKKAELEKERDALQKQLNK